MTRRLQHSLAAMLAIALVAGGVMPAAADAPPVRYESVGNASSVKVEGTSNIHDWDGTTNRIEGSIEVPGQWVDDGDAPRLEPALTRDDAEPRIEVRIPVQSLEGNRRGLASNMHDAMKADDHPYVSFALSELRQTASQNAAGARWSVRGDLTVAGTTRALDLELTLTSQQDDRLRIDVARDLKMTDFNIDPPRAMLGMARAADDVEVEITWVLQRVTPEPTHARFDAGATEREAVGALVEAYDRSRSAMAAGALDEAHAAWDEVDDAFETLEALELPDADAEALEQWQQRVDQVRSAVQGFVSAEALRGARASFAVLTNGLTQVLEMVAPAGTGHVASYHHPEARGIAGAAWLEPRNADADAPRSPYADAPPADGAPRLRAIYPAISAEND